MPNKSRLTALRGSLMRASLLAVAAVPMIVCAAPPTPHAAPPVQAAARPNILVIVADDLGFSDLGAFGSEIATPNLDALAARGMKLTSFYTAPACSPTRAMLLSGLDNHLVGLGSMAEGLTPQQRGADGYEGYLSTRAKTLAERLQPAGYTTLLVGKWHLGEQPGHTPAARGFTHSYALLQGAHNHFGADQTPVYRTAGAVPDYEDDGHRVTYPVGAFASDYFSDRMIRYLKDAPKDRPFFAYLAYTDPHWPLQAPSAMIAKYRGRYDAGPAALREQRLARLQALGLISKDLKPHPLEQDAGWAKLSPEARAKEVRKMEIYAAMVDRMDINIGRVLATLRADGRLSNTLVFFMSDNGPEGLVFDRPINPGSPAQPIDTPTDNSLANMGAADSFFSYGPVWARMGSTPLWGTKEHTSEGGIRVPAIIAGPGVVRGRTSNAVVHVTDIVPTMLAAAAIAPSQVMDAAGRPLPGKNWARLLSGQAGAVRTQTDTIGWELFYRSAIRRGDMKAVFQPNRIPLLGPLTKPGEVRWQLYNIARDPGETHDLAAERPSVLRDLQQRWQDYASRVGVVLLPEDTNHRAEGK